jgi:GNAT superfamily N-acetyltransferase
MKIREPINEEEFIELPYILSKENPYWVCDLRENSIKLISDKHPFWLYAEKKLFVCEDGGKIVGRICGIINKRYNQFHNENGAFFGFFDCINDYNVSKALFESVENWAREKKCSFIRGPANPSSNYTWGILIENFEEPNVVMMPYNPPYYRELLERNHYRKEKDLFAFKWVYNDEIISRMKGFEEKIISKNKNLYFEFIDLKNIDLAFRYVKEVYNKAWEKNWGFVPMSEEEIRNMSEEIKPILKKDYVFFVKDGERTVAFCFILPDFNIALKKVNGKINIFNIIPFLYYLLRIKSGRMLALGVVEEYRGRGIEVMVILKAIEVINKLGWKWGELSWTLEDNLKINKTIEKFGGRVYKKYRIYRKDL